MHRLLTEKKVDDSGPVWGEIRGVRLTKVDEEEQYASESLTSALDSNDGGRHVARIAHLYLARMPSLTQADLEVHLITLVKKILGPTPMVADDWGWLGSVIGLQLPRRLRDELRRDLDSTFNKDKWSSEAQKAFRVFQLLDPQEQENLFKVIYCRPNSQFQYLFPLMDLPPRTEEALNTWRAGSQNVFIPALYLHICGDPSRVLDGYIQLDLPDWFTLRLVNWFVGNLSRSPNSSSLATTTPDPLQPKIQPPPPLRFLVADLPDVVASNPALELLLSYFEAFMPSGKSTNTIKGLSPRSCAIFRWAITDLWLNRIKLAPADPWVPLPSRRLLQSLFILIVYMQSNDGLLVSDDRGDAPLLPSLALLTFRTPLLRFFIYCLHECTFDGHSSLDVIIDLWSVYLTPWKAPHRLQASNRASDLLAPIQNAGRPVNEGINDQNIWFVVHNFLAYVLLFRETLERLDQESNPNLLSLEAFARVVRDDGPISPFVLCVLLACHEVISHERITVPSLLDNTKNKQRIFSLIENNAEGVRRSIDTQLEEFYFNTNRPELYQFNILASGAAHVKNFVRELMHKRKASAGFAVPGLVGGSTHMTTECERLCSLFHVKIELDSQSTPLLSKISALGAPDIEWKQGTPSWLRNKAQTFRFRGLTNTGRRQLQMGLREGNADLAAQYIGDYSSRPLGTYEIPMFVTGLRFLMVWMEKGVNVHVDLRPLADSRNLF